MVILSTLRRQINLLTKKAVSRVNNVSSIRSMSGGHEHFVIEPTRFVMLKIMDMMHFYTCVSFLIYGPIILYTNVFIGDAELREIPDGYIPEKWEYYKHPITRFFAKYQFSQEKCHESILHNLYYDQWHYLQSLLDQKVKKLMKERNDYKAHWYTPISGIGLRDAAHVQQYQEIYTATDPVKSYGYPHDFKDDGDFPEPPTRLN